MTETKRRKLVANTSTAWTPCVLTLKEIVLKSLQKHSQIINTPLNII